VRSNSSFRTVRDEPLGEGVGLGSADRHQNHPGIVGLKHFVERACELGVTVTNQEPDVIQSAFDREVARLLGNPPAIRVPGHPDDPNLPCPDLDQEQHVERALEHSLHGEEITRQDPLSLGPQELGPVRPVAAGSRLDARAA
jgi:hypothetical protein